MKKLPSSLLFIVVLTLLGQSLPAQILGPDGTSPTVFEVDSNGILSSTGTENGTSVLTTAEEGAGTRLLWYPGKAAFRAGTVSGTDWNDANIGVYSAAFGQDTLASGSNSFAAGYDSSATNLGAVGIGWNAAATNTGSVALGYGVTASGPYSIALGEYTTASQSNAIAMGAMSIADMSYAVALGFAERAYGMGSLAAGYVTEGLGSYSAAFNDYTTATAYAATAFGQFNLNEAEGGGTPSSTSWVNTPGAADPLFEVGDGTSSAPADAFVIYKDGSAKLAGPLQVPQSGDIPMYTGGN